MLVSIIALSIMVALLLPVAKDSSAQLKVKIANVTEGDIGRVDILSTDGVKPKCSDPCFNENKTWYMLEFDKDIIQVGERFWVCHDDKCTFRYNGPEKEPEEVQLPLPLPFDRKQVEEERTNAIRDICIESHVIPLEDCKQTDLDISQVCGILRELREHNNPTDIEC